MVEKNMKLFKLSKPSLLAMLLPIFLFFADAAAAVELPARLKIPKIRVDSLIENVGLTRNGEVGVPKGIANAGWFNAGPRPGEVGSAIIDGHYGWKYGRPALFNNLQKLRVGDKIYVKDKKNMSISFVVRALRSYGKNDDATAVFSANDGKSHLNLITCEGIWDKATKTYSKRLVVFTDKE